MAHDLVVDKETGKTSMAYVGDKPWHGLGIQLDEGASPQQMLEAAGLDWTVGKRAMSYKAAGKSLSVPDQRALVKEDDGQLLSIVGEGWNPIQNAEAFDLFSEFCEQGDMTMETAGALKDNQIVWGLAKVKDSFELKFGKKTDVVESHFLFTNPHQFGRSADVRFTPIRVVCNNTLTLALGSKAQLKISHRNAFDKDAVLDALGIAEQKMDVYQEAAQHLANKKTAADDLIDYFNQIFPNTYERKTDRKASDQLIDQLSKTAKMGMEALETQPGAELGAGTWWSAYNAVTYLVDHRIGNTVDSRLQNSWYGQAANKKTKALQLATQFANAS